jgi:uracil-DNA glycosylase
LGPGQKIDGFDALLADIRACAVCAPTLPLGPRPIIQAGKSATLLIIGQAPGSRVHESGVPWQDQSGDRLRDWTGLEPGVFYNPGRVALMPMGFCYPGVEPGGGDSPPRPECAPLWHEKLRRALPAIRLTLLVGSFAQRAYLKTSPKLSLTDAVRSYRDTPSGLFPLPHPSWRSTGWMRRNPWFELETLPALRATVATSLHPG